jgi:succinoglycan biosynthesis transport protein ExoP
MQTHAARGSVLELGLEMWSRRQWLAVVVCVLTLAFTVSIVTFLPNMYRATATVLVERHQVPESFIKSSITGELETRLQTISQQIFSRAKLEDLIHRLGLYQELRARVSMEAAVEKMRGDMKLELKGVEQQMSGRTATVAFNLNYRGRDPETVAKVANTLASFYVEENSKMRERQASQTAQFLKDQLDEAKKRLDEQEGRLRAFRARHAGELPQQMGVNLATLERLQAQLHLNSANQVRARDQRARGLSESDVAGGAFDTGATKLAKLKRELLDLRTRYSDKYPDVVRVKAEIAALERVLAGTKPDGDPVGDSAALSEADEELKALKAEEQRLRRDISMYQRRVENTPQREQELVELSRGFETVREQYGSLLKRHEDAQLSESMEQSRQGEEFRILDPAIPARQPSAPNRIRLFLVGVLLSLGAAAAAAVLAERLDTSFHSFDDLRSFTKIPPRRPGWRVGDGWRRLRSRSDWPSSCSRPITWPTKTSNWSGCCHGARRDPRACLVSLWCPAAACEGLSRCI